MSNLIELQNICKSYHDGDQSHTVLHKINWSIPNNSFIAIQGTSGSGKTTLMNVLGLMDRADAGQYYFNGELTQNLTEETRAEFRNAHIGFVFQAFYLLPYLNVIKNVLLPLQYSSKFINRSIALDRAHYLLEYVGISNLAERLPHQLSSGQQQRVAIARALINEPQLLLADEPTGALDPMTAHQIMELIKSLNQDKQTTVILVTHDPSIAATAQKQVILNAGQLIL